MTKNPKSNLTSNSKQATSSSACYSLSIAHLKYLKLQNCHYGENVRFLLSTYDQEWKNS